MPPSCDVDVDILIIGAGACGLVAALSAHQADKSASLLIIDRDERPAGSTALSSGFVPAAGTALQRKNGVEDSPSLFAHDIQAKAKGQAYQPLVQTVTEHSAHVIDWLSEQFEIPFILLDNFLYPGHTVHRMHAMPQKTGAALHSALWHAALSCDIPIACGYRADTLLLDHNAHVQGVMAYGEDGQTQCIKFKKLILACNGYGGNKELIAEHIPQMADAMYFGHAGNQGDAVLWGKQLGAALADMSGYQGHGSVAWPHGVLISWALMMDGALLINAEGLRFSNEHEGYSEQAARVIQQPGQTAYVLFDERLLELGRSFPDFVEAEKAGALIKGDQVVDLAQRLKIAPNALQGTLALCKDYIQATKSDPLGRDFRSQMPLSPPYYAIQVTGALFHTQGGLDINTSCEVLDQDGKVIPNLLAAGGAARGVSGPNVSGYLSGNGLLTALTLGHIAGQQAAKSIF